MALQAVGLRRRDRHGGRGTLRSLRCGRGWGRARGGNRPFPPRSEPRRAIISRPSSRRRSRSRRVKRLSHDDVPSSWLSTGGRSWWKCSRHELGQRQGAGTLLRFQPYAFHLRLHLAAAVLAHAAARAVPQRLRAGHRAGHPGVVQDALPAHLAPEDRVLDGVLDDGDDAHARPAPAGAARRGAPLHASSSSPRRGRSRPPRRRRRTPASRVHHRPSRSRPRAALPSRAPRC